MKLVGKVSGDFFLRDRDFGGGGGGRGVLSLYKQKNWGMGAGQRKRGAMLSIQSENQLKTCY